MFGNTEIDCVDVTLFRSVMLRARLRQHVAFAVPTAGVSVNSKKSL